MDATTPTRPTLAEIARSAITAARIATTWAGAAFLPGQAVTVVRVAVDDAGRPILLFDARSPVAGQMDVTPVVTVSVSAAEPFRSLELTGRVHRCVDEDTERHRAYRVLPMTVRLVGVEPRDVSLAGYFTAAPDPLARDAARILSHLTLEHGADLTACVRAHGRPEAEWVVPRTLNRFGLGLAVLDDSGVTSLRLGFPNGPIRSFEELASYLRVALTCPCRHQGQVS